MRTHETLASPLGKASELVVMQYTFFSFGWNDRIIEIENSFKN